MKRLCILLLLLMVSGWCFADTSASIASSAVSNQTDMSITYLGMVFGTVGDSVHGVSGQMLGMLFYKFNEGMLVVAGVLLVWSSILTVTRLATEGLATGQQRNVHMLAIRIATGIAFLVPSATTGYNLAQDLLMRVVVESVKMADMTWSYGLDYIYAGGSLWTPPDVAASAAKIGPASQVFEKAFWKSAVTTSGASTPTLSDLGVIPKVFELELCMYAGYNKAQQRASTNSGNSNSYTSNTSNVTPPIPVYNSGNSTITFPSNFSTGPCGIIDINSMSNVDDAAVSDSTPSPINNQTFALQAAHSVVNNTLPAAKAYYCSQNSSADFCSGYSASSNSGSNASIATAFLGAYLAEINAIRPIQRSKTNGTTAQDLQFIPDAKKLGWALAGRYYYSLTRLSRVLEQSVDLSSYVVSNAVSSGGSFKYQSFPIQGDDGVNATLTKLIKSVTDANSKGATANFNPDASSLAQGLMGAILSYMGGPIYTLIFGIGALITDFENITPDPILMLSNVGFDLINIAGSCLMAALTGAVLWGLAGTACSGEVKLNSTFQAVSKWMRPLCLGITVMLVGAGVMFSYYLPLYPFLIYTFAVLGWLAVVIEAMVAMPLVALGVTHPEGHDFLGRSEQAVMLVLGVFLRPTLLVVGLIAAMIMAFVSLRILNFGFANVLADIYLPGASFGSTTASNQNMSIANAAGAFTAEVLIRKTGGLGSLLIKLMLTFPIVLMMFAAVIYQVINQCYTLVFTLPDYVLKWLGVQAHQGAFNPAQMTGQIQSATQGAMQKSGQIAETGMRNYMHAKNSDSADGSGSDGSGGDSSGGGSSLGSESEGGGAVS